ncbi:uncharacterized protein LOC128958354 [Oppia nitens]|uniref:uncharacterized protein LOC128958354 n=1 Tax=Oppia nitens TaxID=1686743 RepID=UPI0023DBCC1C|nr:uncharacterized protein LOC128958354 [Oppia nitens]
MSDNQSLVDVFKWEQNTIQEMYDLPFEDMDSTDGQFVSDSIRINQLTVPVLPSVAATVIAATVLSVPTTGQVVVAAATKRANDILADTINSKLPELCESSTSILTKADNSSKQSKAVGIVAADADNTIEDQRIEDLFDAPLAGQEIEIQVADVVVRRGRGRPALPVEERLKRKKKREKEASAKHRLKLKADKQKNESIYSFQENKNPRLKDKLTALKQEIMNFHKCLMANIAADRYQLKANDKKRVDNIIKMLTD